MLNRIRPKNALRTHLGIDCLEDRTTPTAAAITADFNAAPIGAGNTIWFNSSGQVSGLGTSPASIKITDGTITFAANGTPYSVHVPDTTVTFTMLAVQATTTFTADGWQVTAPPSFAGNVFLGGATLKAPSPTGLLGGLLGGLGLAGGLPGNIKNVKWQSNFATDTPGLHVNWQWGTAVYNSFGSTLGSIGVKTVDDASVDAYHNVDRAGTPEAFKLGVTTGGRGYGFTNYTGTLTGSAAIAPELLGPPAPAALSGTVFLDGDGDHAIGTGNSGLGGIEVDLFDSNGALVQSMMTGDDGSFAFTNLTPGNYKVTMNPPDFGYASMYPEVGTLGGTVEQSWAGIDGIGVSAGNAGTGYNLGLWERPS